MNREIKATNKDVVGGGLLKAWKSLMVAWVGLIVARIVTDNKLFAVLAVCVSTIALVLMIIRYVLIRKAIKVIEATLMDRKGE